MKITMKILTFVLALSWFAAPASADLTAASIIEKSKEATQSTTAEHKIRMILVNKRGDELERKMITRSKTKNGLNRSVTTFLYPNETKGTKFLMVENADRDDDMKIFVPELKRVRTISSSQRRQSYMGTDFAYGDLEALDPKIGQHKRLDDAEIKGEGAYVVESSLDPKSTGYSKMINWFRKDNFVPIKTEYYDKDGDLKKVRTVSDIYQEGDVWVMKKMVMEDVQKNHKTVIEIVGSSQKPIDDSYFTEQFLRQTDKL